MNHLLTAWHLAKKDLRSFVRDRLAMLLSILVPIMLVTVFGFIMQYAFGGSGGMPKVSLHIADLDKSATSKELVDNLAGQDMIRIRHVDLDEKTERDATDDRLKNLIKNGDAHHILVIPVGYADQVAKGETPEFKMLRDPGRSMEDQIVQISIMQASMTQLGGTLWVDAMDRMLSDQGMDTQQLGEIRGWMTSIGTTIGNFVEVNSSEEEASTLNESGDGADEQTAAQGSASGEFDTNAMMSFMSNALPIETTDVAPPDRNKQITYQQAQSVAGMTVMMLLFALSSCGSVLIVERDEGTLRRLFAQPIPRNSILLGKFLFVFIVGTVQIAILFTYGEWMFNVGLFRDPVTTIVLSLAWVAAGGAFGMFLAAVSRSQKQAEGLATLLILMMAALGGCWFPLQLMNLPTALELVCKSTMTYWAMTGLQGMLWNQLPWYSAKTLTAIGWQLGWAAVLTVLAGFFYRRNYCRG